MPVNTIKYKQLLLIGGGHSHLHVIRQLGKNPPENTRIYLISRDRLTPYSGMLPGLIAGHYQFSDTHIDLEKLCRHYAIDFIHKEVTHIDLLQQQISCSDQSTLDYDCLSLNIGSQPAVNHIHCAEQIGIAVKPIAPFLDQWQQIISQWMSDIKPTSPDTQPHSQFRFKFHSKSHLYPKPFTSKKIAIVGGGAASIEVAFACQYRLQQLLNENGLHTKRQIPATSDFEFNLYTANNALLVDTSPPVRQFIQKRLQQRRIGVHLNHKAVEATQKEGQCALHFDKQPAQTVDLVIWAIDATGPGWISNTGLGCNDRHFVTVNPFLQSTSHANVFAAGDIAHFCEQPLAKSGVYAVRAGEILSQNLSNYINGQALLPFKPQPRFLKLLTTGDKYAIASRGNFFTKGRWVWHWKNWIDRRFIKQYQ